MKFDKNDTRFFALAAAVAIALTLLLRPVIITALEVQDFPLPTWASPGKVSGFADKHPTSPTLSSTTPRPTTRTIPIAAAPSTPAPTPRPRKLTYYEQTRGGAARTASSSAKSPVSHSASKALNQSATDNPSPGSAEAYAKSKQAAEAKRLLQQVNYWQSEYDRMRRDKIYDGLVQALEQLGKAKAELARVQSHTYFNTLVHQHRRLHPTPVPTPRKPTVAEREATIRENARAEALKAKIYREEFEKVGLPPPQ